MQESPIPWQYIYMKDIQLTLWELITSDYETESI